MELIAGAARQAGHDVRILDLQVETHGDYFRLLKEWWPHVVALSCNYLPNVPEIIDLAKMTKASFANIFIVAGGHSLSFVAREVLEHAEGAIDVIVKGEREPLIGPSSTQSNMTAQMYTGFPVWSHEKLRDRIRQVSG